MSLMDAHTRTLEDIRRTLEELANTCESEMRRDGCRGRELELLRNVVSEIQEARAHVLDVSIATAQYLTHCL